ncbi:MAG: sirohydrochlorin cobaltochelatase [Desulfocurvibacter africanus]
MSTHCGHHHGHGRDKRDIRLGILLAAFGTAVSDARQAYDAFEERVRELYPHARLGWAYTANKVRRKLAERGYGNDSVAVALSKMVDEGVTHVAVQSLHTVPGVEYHWTLDQARAFLQPRKGFTDVRVGVPLLHSQVDLARAVQALRGYIPEGLGEVEAVVLVGHGTYHDGQARYIDYQAAVAHMRPMVLVGTLMGEPGLEVVLETLRARNVRKATLVPFMGVPGHHVREDMFGEQEDSWACTFERAGIACARIMTGTLEHEGFAAIWLDHLRQAMDGLGAGADTMGPIRWKLL